jgi:hypothetical protein
MEDFISFINKSENEETPAEKLLKQGIPVYYLDDNITDGTVKEYPDGRKEVVTLDNNYNEVLVRTL